MPIHHHPNRNIWSIELPVLTLAWQANEQGNIELASLATGGKEWLSSPVAPFDEPLRVGNVESNESTLSIHGTLVESGLTARIDWHTYPGTSVIRSEITLSNHTDATIDVGSLPSLRLQTLAAPGSQFAMLAGGRWDESMPPRGYRYATYDLDEYSANRARGVAADGRSSGEWIPWFGLNRPQDGLFAGLVWSGRWDVRTGRQDGQFHLSLGISDFRHLLAPGASVELPGVVLSGYRGDLDTGANQWRRWMTDFWTPAVPENWPWVQYNHWYAYYGDIDQERLYKEAEHADAAGCEVFVIDDGWFTGRRKESYHAGWGDWTEDRAKFPDGLKAFGDRVRSLGMKFGLWVEPERAAIDSPVLQAHPDFVATRDGVPLSRPEADKGSVHLCLGNPAVQEWMTAEITRVVQEYGIDWLKWDYNIGYGLGCNVPDHGHQAGDGHHAHTLGLYRVLASLRKHCPDLVIENCASGGHRVDLGTLRHTHTNWVSDYTNRAASCRQHTQGAGLFMPLAHLNTWSLQHRGLTEFRSRFGGAFGISWFLEEWSPQDRETLRQAIAEYKQLRPLLSGNRFLLTGPWHQDWDIWQFVGKDGKASAILAFRETGGIDQIRVRPHVPDTSASWSVLRENDAQGDLPGGELADHGLEISLPEHRSSAVIWLRRRQ